MRAAVVVEADPVTDDAGRVLDVLEAMAMNALLLERADNPLDHAVLLRPSVPKRLIRACSKTALALPERNRCQPLS